jgi:hypothetical protein
MHQEELRIDVGFRVPRIASRHNVLQKIDGPSPQAESEGTWELETVDFVGEVLVNRDSEKI